MRLIILLLLISSSVYVQAFKPIKTDEDVFSPGFYSGNELYELCNTNRSACLYYVTGSVDATDEAICISSEVSNVQLRDVVTKHLTDNPQERHNPAWFIVRSSLAKNFPCE